MADVLLTASERYALPILAPLAEALRARGDRVHLWFAGAMTGIDAGLPGIAAPLDIRGAVALRPRAVYCAMNWVPPFFAGAKVQLFHGFNAEKRDPGRGHFRLRGLFDLYCTQGPSTTLPFAGLAREHGHFKVVETGWPKLDPLFRGDAAAAAALRAPAGDRGVVLFASTFTDALTAAPRLHDAIAAEIATGRRYWLLTLHPKTGAATVARYRALAGDHACFVEPEDLVAAERAADVLLADTTSVVQEFAVQRKPVATFRHRARRPYMLDFDAPADLAGVLDRVFAPDPARAGALAAFADELHPSRDGRASDRVIAATDALIAGELGPLRRRPVTSLLRGLQLRAELGYWGRGGA